ncbi:MAG: hypothetical protein GF308_12310 [Candidatus Heimdallarchaeota archaeon]|nr:hypothetical protein [Candidatus Heimdallarchaeota archaeon]
MKKRKLIILFDLSIIILFLSLLSSIVIHRTIEKNDESSGVLFEVDDEFSYDQAFEFTFEGNITGYYSNTQNNYSLVTGNFSVEHWSIINTLATHIRILNISETTLKLSIQQHFSHSVYEGFKCPNNRTIKRVSFSEEFLTKDNVSIDRSNYQITESTNQTYFPTNKKNQFFIEPDPEIGQQVEIMREKYLVVNTTTMETFEGERNVTNAILLKPSGSNFIYSHYLQKYIYFGEFTNISMLSFGREDGVLLSGRKLHECKSYRYAHPAEGEVTISDNLDIVSSSLEPNKRKQGPIYILIIGLVLEIIIIYFFERGAIKKWRGIKGEPVEKLEKEEKHIRQLEIYRSAKNNEWQF